MKLNNVRCSSLFKLGVFPSDRTPFFYFFALSILSVSDLILLDGKTIKYDNLHTAYFQFFYKNIDTFHVYHVLNAEGLDLFAYEKFVH